jgi:DNA-binding SARP family transcriptional activator/ABC-type branched-subunit amino acid transport system substrate-binding protein/streptogramin lyase
MRPSACYYRHMEFRLLGALEVLENGQRIPIEAPRQRALLALLLLHRGEPAATERLVEELWGEDAPASAVKTVQVYVAQLRKVLGANVLVTHGHGYALALDPHEFDVDRFERLAAEGRRLLDDGNAKGAAERLREALALWRGRPLADFTYAEFAQSEITRLEDERLAALETRVEAELALGCQEQLVPELQALVRDNPLRERLQGHLMLSLYRAGRQAEALEAYRKARRQLDELGIEPSRELRELEQAVLRQDPALDAPRRGTLSSSRRRGGVLVLVGGALFFIAAAAALALALTRGDRRMAIGPNQLLTLDLGTGKVAARIGVGNTPTAVAVGQGGVWTLNADDKTVSRIDPKTGRTVQTFGTGSTPVGLAVGAGALWVMNGRASGAGLVGQTIPVSVSRLHPESAIVAGTTQLPRAAAGDLGPQVLPGANRVAVAPGAVWAIGPGSSLSRLDARTGELVATVPGIAAISVAAEAAGAWVVDSDLAIVRIDARTNTVARRIPLAASSLAGIALGGGAVWVADPIDGTVWRVEPGPRTITRTLTVGVGVTGVAYGHGALWAVNFFERTVSRIDSGSNAVTSRTELDATPQGVAVGAHGVWVSTTGPVRGRLVAGVHALRRSSCGPVESGGRAADVLIASDLPLQGAARQTTVAIAEGIRFVLARHGFRAGNHRVAYQSCDDATAQAGTADLGKCSVNAKGYADNPSVVGVIGTYNSDCTSVEVPIANKAVDGPLAMLSPANTDPALTHGTPTEFRLLYPTGTRSFVRIASPDDVQGAALALLAKRLGLQRVFVLTDGEAYGKPLSGGFRRAATKLGLDIVGSARWKLKERSYAHLALRVERSRAQGVLLAGIAYSDGARVAREIRSRLPRVQLFAGDGFLAIPDYRKTAGAAAVGTYVSYPSAASVALPAGGQAFLRAFGQTHPRQTATSFSAAYGAAAAETMLTAIARSDGSRASVNRELRRVRIENGILGSFGFTPEGDVTPAPITIVRVVSDAKKHSPVGSDFNGSVLDRVLWVRVSLAR